MDGMHSGNEQNLQDARPQVLAQDSPDIPVDQIGQPGNAPRLAEKSGEPEDSRVVRSAKSVTHNEQKALSGACEACRRIKVRESSLACLIYIISLAQLIPPQWFADAMHTRRHRPQWQVQ